MTAHTLPDEPVYAFAPSYDLPDQPPQIRVALAHPSSDPR